MKKIPYSILCGLISILVTILLYFLIIGNIFLEVICLITLLGVVFAEIITTLLAFFSKAEPRKVAATGLSALMIPVSVILSGVYILNFPEGYASYLKIYFIVYAVILTISAIIWKFTSHKNDEKAAFQNAKNNMLQLRNLVKCIMLEANAEKYKKELTELEEKFRFSNDAVITPADANIKNMLLTLKNNINDENFDIAAQISTISKEADLRNIYTK